MATLEVTNLTNQVVNLRDLYTQLAPGQKKSFANRYISQLETMPDLMGEFKDGNVSINILPTPAELALGTPSGLNAGLLGLPIVGGGGFTSFVIAPGDDIAAVIADAGAIATAADPQIVLIKPGDYVLSADVDLPSFVSVQGLVDPTVFTRYPNIPTSVSRPVRIEGHWTYTDPTNYPYWAALTNLVLVPTAAGTAKPVIEVNHTADDVFNKLFLRNCLINDNSINGRTAAVLVVRSAEAHAQNCQFQAAGTGTVEVVRVEDKASSSAVFRANGCSFKANGTTRNGVYLYSSNDWWAEVELQNCIFAICNYRQFGNDAATTWAEIAFSRISTNLGSTQSPIDMEDAFSQCTVSLCALRGNDSLPLLEAHNKDSKLVAAGVMQQYEDSGNPLARFGSGLGVSTVPHAGSTAFETPPYETANTSVSEASFDHVVDVFLSGTGTGPVTVTMGATPTPGRHYRFWDTGNNAGTNNITINGNGTLINGAATAVINTNSGSFELVADATGSKYVGR